MTHLRIEKRKVRVRGLYLWAIAALLFWLGVEARKALPAPSEAAAKPIDFDRAVRPILSDNCFACHGPDEKQRMANLRLDETEGLFADRGGYKIVAAGDSAHSKLYQKIRPPDPAFRMPPHYANRKLSAQQNETINQCIDQEAKRERHQA